MELDPEALQTGLVGNSGKKKMRAYISKSINVPFVGLAWPVPWEVCGGDVGDGLGVDVDDLERLLELVLDIEGIKTYPSAFKFLVRRHKGGHDGACIDEWLPCSIVGTKKSKSSLRATGNIFAGLRRRGEATILCGTTYFLLQKKQMNMHDFCGRWS